VTTSAPPPPTTDLPDLAISLGQGARKSDATTLAIRANGAGPVVALAEALRTQPRTNNLWWSGHVFDGKRQERLWRGSRVVMVDFDYRIGPGAEGHVATPPAVAAELAEAVAAGFIPGSLFHATPRGGRIVFVLAQTCTDAARMKRAILGAVALVERALRGLKLLGAPSAAPPVPGFDLDDQAVDLARFMWPPVGLVDGKPRSSEIVVISRDPVAVDALLEAAPAPAAPKPTPPRSSPTRSYATIDEAVDKWNADHPPTWPLRTTSDNCPICGGKGGFGGLPERPGKWFCWHASHPDDVGHKTERGHFGDALDLEAFLRRRSRTEVLRADGYLAPAQAPRPLPEPPPGFFDGPPDDDAPPLEEDLAALGAVTDLPPTSTTAPFHEGPPAPRPLRALPPIVVEVAIPEIEITTDEPVVVDAALAALQNHPAAPYRRAGLLVHVVHDSGPASVLSRPKDAPRISALPPARLRELIAGAARLVKYDGRSDSLKPAHPPDWLVAEVIGRQRWPGLRPLEAVVECPTLRPDGSILSEPGYDRTTGILYEPSIDFPPIPARPTRNDAIVAVARLSDVVVDFPFAAPAHRSAWLSSVLTTIARHAFPGPSPLNLIDANTRGAGKSLLADVTSEIVSGRPMARMPNVDDDDEWTKRILALAIEGDPLVLIDNISGTLGAPALDAALTGTEFKGRILGVSSTARATLVMTWFATGNNVVLSGDLARRCAHIRLESPEELPERREGFHHPDLIGFVRRNRAQLVTAALVILAGYSAAGRPDMHLPPWGSFEGWSKLVRCALVWAGEPDPGETRMQLQTAADRDGQALGQLIAGWEEVAHCFVGDRCTVAQALAHLALPDNKEHFQALRSALAELVPTDPGKPISPHRIGKALQKFKGRVVGGKALQNVSEHTMAGVVWAVRAVER
jgi:hypothetical protein